MKISITEEDLDTLDTPMPKQATTLQEAAAMTKLAHMMDSLGEEAATRVLRWGIDRCKSGLLTQVDMLKKQATVTDRLIEQFRKAQREENSQPIDIHAPSPVL